MLLIIVSFLRQTIYEVPTHFLALKYLFPILIQCTLSSSELPKLMLIKVSSFVISIIINYAIFVCIIYILQGHSMVVNKNTIKSFQPVQKVRQPETLKSSVNSLTNYWKNFYIPTIVNILATKDIFGSLRGHETQKVSRTGSIHETVTSIMDFSTTAYSGCDTHMLVYIRERVDEAV